MVSFLFLRIWYSFKGLSEKTSLILNISNSEHDEKILKKLIWKNFH